MKAYDPKKQKEKRIYIISKDMYFVDKDGNGSVISDPIEVLAHKHTAEDHYSRLLNVAPKMSEMMKKVGNYKECRVSFRCSILDEKTNNLVEKVLAEFEKEEDETNEPAGESKSGND